MTRNQRVQLADLGERWIRAWARHDVSREDAAVMVTYWHLYEPADEELVAEVLGRFAPAEPPSVPGVDFLPPRRWRDRDGQFWSVGSDDLISLETERGPSRLFVLATVEELADLYGPLVEVQPDAEQVQPLGVRMGDTCGPEHTFREFCQYAGEVQS